MGVAASVFITTYFFCDKEMEKQKESKCSFNLIKIFNEGFRGIFHGIFYGIVWPIFVPPLLKFLWYGYDKKQIESK